MVLLEASCGLESAGTKKESMTLGSSGLGESESAEVLPDPGRPPQPAKDVLASLG